MVYESVSTANWEEKEGEETWTEMIGSLKFQPTRQNAAGSSL